MVNTSFRKGLFLATVSAIMWGTFGSFLRLMIGHGLSDVSISTFAPTVMTLYFGIKIFTQDKSKFNIGWKLLSIMVLNGVLIIGMNFAYLNAVQQIPVAIVSLLAFCNVIVLITIERLIYKIKVSKNKIIAVLLALLGVSLVLQVFSIGTCSLSLSGILWAASNALILGTVYTLISHVYFPTGASYEAILFYPNLFSMLIMWFLSPPWKMIANFTSASNQYGIIVWILLIGFSIIPQIGSYSLLLKAFSLIDAPYVSLTYCFDPVVALVIGVLVFKDSITTTQLLGITLAVAAVAYINFSESKQPDFETT